ncbi:hypothetical protein ACI3PL_30890, partial [Lacticaseibacillus paracasei]
MERSITRATRHMLSTVASSRRFASLAANSAGKFASDAMAAELTATEGWDTAMILSKSLAVDVVALATS